MSKTGLRDIITRLHNKIDKEDIFEMQGALFACGSIQLSGNKVLQKKRVHLVQENGEALHNIREVLRRVHIL